MYHWMANSSPPWDAYCTLMACCLVALDKMPGVCPVGIGETLRRPLDKLIMRSAGDQSKTTCGNIQLCAGLEAGIEGAPHSKRQRSLERVRKGQSEEEARRPGKDDNNDEAEGEERRTMETDGK